MKTDDLKKILSDCVNDIAFEYNGKPCGLTVEVENYIPSFQMWCGESTKEYKDIQEVMNDNFFDGKSLSDLLCSQSDVKYSIL